MGLKICVLGSGSGGNCTYVASETTAVLIDAGFSGVETERRLAQIGAQASEIRAICLTHEHTDHVAGVRVLHQRHGIALYANSGTADSIRRDERNKELRWNIFSTGSDFECGDLVLTPFAVPHDAYEPVGFVIRQGDLALGVVTDIGVSTTLVRERLKSCRALVLEANHDEELLQQADRPWHLKQRIRGRQGHLSNKHAAELLVELAGPHLQHVFLAHLSEECNRCELALSTVRGRLANAGHAHVEVTMSYPDRVSELRRVE